MSDLCPYCKVRHLLSEIERDTGICGRCADIEYDRFLNRQEWDHYHPPLEPHERTPPTDTPSHRKD